MVPYAPDVELRLKNPPATARKSAVLVPLLIREGGLPDVMFTLRSDTLRSHSGQISFPGGRMDEGEDAVTAALREMQEETGVEPESVMVLGALSDLYIPPSNSAV
ncbi:MAG: CoA pyrophosphatase, partial [Ignavibacteriae bacterium]